MEEFNENKALLTIIEPPIDQYRYAFKQEVSNGGPVLKGINSNKFGYKTNPSVEIKNGFGTIIIRCSIYQINSDGNDFLPHSNELCLWRQATCCDPFHIIVGPDNGYRAEFKNLVITITKKANIVSTLVRKKSQLKKEYIARTEGFIRELSLKEIKEIEELSELESKVINTDVVCLRFDAFTEKNNILYPICKPLFSEPIFNTRLLVFTFLYFPYIMPSHASKLLVVKELITGSNTNDFNICMLNRVTSQAKGNKKVTLLVKLNINDADNIKIRFYELDEEENLIWEDWGTDVHVHRKRINVSLKTPKYYDNNITAPVNVLIELVRPINNTKSKARRFRYIPNNFNVSSGLSTPTKNQLKKNQITDYILFDSWDIPNGYDEDLPIAADNFNSEEFKKLYREYQQKFAVYFKSLETAPLPQSQYIPFFDEYYNYFNVTPDERTIAVGVLEELISFIKTVHTSHQAVHMLNNLLETNHIKNALQIFTCLKDNKSAIFIIKMIAFYKAFHLLEMGSNNRPSPLHTAILCGNEVIIRCLLICGARISSLDHRLNTPLHLAAEYNTSIEIFELLLRDDDKFEKINDFINMENSDGDTVLTILLQKRDQNLDAIKLLLQKNVDINKIHPKNGYVPIRFVVERHNIETFKFFLTLKNMNPYIEDFIGMNPLTAALFSSCPEIVAIAQRYNMDELDRKVEEEMEVFYNNTNIFKP